MNRDTTGARPGPSALRWLAPAAWMVVIFLFSAQTGSDSAGLSGHIVDAAKSFLHQFGAQPDPETLGLIVRKTAHVTEYAVLGGLLTWAWRAWPGRSSLRNSKRGRWSALAGPAALGVLYAATDEFHQLFVPGRAGQISDVAIDAIGVLLGVLLVGAARWLRYRQRS